MSDHPAPEKSFEAALAELESIVRDLEDGTTGLDVALTQFECGIGLLNTCYSQLRQAEKRILVLTGKDDEGLPIVEEFDHIATVDLEKPERGRARTRAKE